MKSISIFEHKSKYANGTAIISNGVKDIEAQLISIVEKAIANLGITLPPTFGQVYFEFPKDSHRGDLSTNVAMRLYKIAHQNVFEFANILASKIEELLKKSELSQIIDRVEVKQPGFINFFVSRSYLTNALDKIIKERKDYGRTNTGRGKRVNIEFVSANPTGPLTVAHARQAAFGDSLANVLEFTGFKVVREYYLNDEGNQINILGRSVQARCLQLQGDSVEFPQDGYKGDYIIDIARRIKNPKGISLEFFCRFGVKHILNMIKTDLKDFGVKFDKWTRQSALHKDGSVKKALSYLKKKGYIYESDGAVWFKSTDFGDDKDRVLVKQDKSHTYITPDIAYHRNKYKRRFNRLIDIWGPDHHGYIMRLKASVKALGHDENSLDIIIVQLSTLYRDGAVIPMSTREGQFVTLRQIMDEAGKDAARFFFLMRDSKAHLDFDLALAKKESPENPVFYVQYAYARICSILEYAKTRSQKSEVRSQKFALNLLKEPEEIELIRCLWQFRWTIETCARKLEPHGITFYLRDLATLFHSFYTKHRVVGDDGRLTAGRLILADCVRQVLENGLRLIGVSAPKKM